MRKSDKFRCIDDLLSWLESQPRFGILERGDDYFTVDCPYDSAITVHYTHDDDIDDIIDKTIERFEDFDADEEFTELWSREFSEENHITPRQFITMLSNDEKTLHDIAYTLKTRFR